MEVISAVRTFITKDLLRNESLVLDDELPLIERGYLTSLQTIELVVFLEERFNVHIRPEEVNEEDFRSLRTIERLVRAKLGGVRVD